MPKLTDIQLIILSTAAKRKDGAPLPLPKSVRIKKEAAARILRSLVKHGAIAERPALRDDAAWRETEDGQRLTLVITDGGRQALGTLPDKGSKTRTAEAKSQQRRSAPAHQSDNERLGTENENQKVYDNGP